MKYFLFWFEIDDHFRQHKKALNGPVDTRIEMCELKFSSSNLTAEVFVFGSFFTFTLFTILLLIFYIFCYQKMNSSVSCEGRTTLDILSSIPSGRCLCNFFIFILWPALASKFMDTRRTGSLILYCKKGPGQFGCEIFFTFFNYK